MRTRIAGFPRFHVISFHSIFGDPFILSRVTSLFRCQPYLSYESNNPFRVGRNGTKRYGSSNNRILFNAFILSETASQENIRVDVFRFIHGQGVHSSMWRRVLQINSSQRFTTRLRVKESVWILVFKIDVASPSGKGGKQPRLQVSIQPAIIFRKRKMIH